MKKTDKTDIKYNLYEISLHKNIIIHTDLNYSDGFFTYDIIFPKNIKLIQTNL